MFASQSIAPPLAAVRASSGNDDWEFEDPQISSLTIPAISCRLDRPLADDRPCPDIIGFKLATCVAPLFDEQLWMLSPCVPGFEGWDLVSLQFLFLGHGKLGPLRLGSTLIGQRLCIVACCSFQKNREELEKNDRRVRDLFALNSNWLVSC